MWVLNWHVYHAYGVYTTILGEVSRRGGIGVLISFRLCVRQLCLYTCYGDDLIVFLFNVN